MATTFRPMLSATWEKGMDLPFPVLASGKLDGERCVIRDGIALSRNLKPFKNKYVQTMLAGLPPYDGELIVGSPVGQDVWNRTHSGVSKIAGEPDFKLYVFDYCHDDMRSVAFKDRLELAHKLVHNNEFCVPHQHVIINSWDEFDQFEEGCVTAGFEGIMVRSLDGPYKWGRSTEREGFLLKVKRWFDTEAEVIGFVEKFHNANEAKINALGLTERSTHKDNKVGLNTLGALICRAEDGTQFELGTGFDDRLRQEIWDNKPNWLGSWVTFKYQHRTPDGSYRFPVFKGKRDIHA